MNLKLSTLACVIAISGLGEGLNGSIAEGENPLIRRADNETAERLAVQYLGDSFAASLSSKEFLDFLLTPALLVQECVSEDVIITYPSE